MTTFNAPQITPKRMLVLTTLKENVVEARRVKIVEILKRIWTGHNYDRVEIQILKVAEDGSLKIKSPLRNQEGNFDALVDDFFNFGDSSEKRNFLLSSETKKLSLGLQWFDTNELGMSVTCPHGNVMKWPDALLDCCNGWLDIHSNESGETTSPIDHIVFGYTPGHGLTIGEYRISIQMLTQRNSQPSKYRMMIDADGHAVHTYSGQIKGENSSQSWGSLFACRDLSDRLGCRRVLLSYLLTDGNFSEEQDALIKSFVFRRRTELVVIPVVEGQSFPALREKIGESGTVVHPDLLGEFINDSYQSMSGLIAYGNWEERDLWPDPQWDNPHSFPPGLDYPSCPPTPADLDTPDPDSEWEW